MRPYKDIPVTITYQNFGSSWLCGLRGKVADIEKVYNGLFYRATEGKLEYQFDTSPAGEALALFWTSEKGMFYFFYRSILNVRLNHDGEDLGAKGNSFENHYAKMMVARLKKERDTFLTFDKRRAAGPHMYGQGTIAAERPDADFKDKVLEYAFSDRV